MNESKGLMEYPHMRSELLQRYFDQQRLMLDAAAQCLARGDGAGAEAVLRMDKDGLEAFRQLMRAQGNLHGMGMAAGAEDGTPGETDRTGQGIRRYEPVIGPASPITDQETYSLPEAGRVLMLGQQSAALARCLAERGLACTAVGAGASPGELEELFGSGAVAGLVGIQDVLWSEEQGLGFVRAMFFGARQMSRAFSGGGPKPFLAAVTRLGGRFGVGSATPGYVCGSVAGLCKTLKKEWGGKAAVRYIDLPEDASDEQISAALTEELRFGAATEVGRPGGSQRFAFSLREAYDTELSDARPGPEDVFLVSGGGRGISSVCIEELAKRCRCGFALLARTGGQPEQPDYSEAESIEDLCRVILRRAAAEGKKPALAEAEAEARGIMARREVSATLRSLEAAGSRVRLYPCDIRDAEAVHRAVHLAETRLGRVTGIIHAAGVISDKSISNKTEDDFNRVFGTKYLGLRNLIASVDAEKLRHIMLFSSVAGYFGNPGQADYSCANEYMDHFARYWKHTHPHCNVQSLCWGPWDGGMATESMKKLWRKLGIKIISPETGRLYFYDALSKRHAAGQCQAVYSDAGDPWRRPDAR